MSQYLFIFDFLHNFLFLFFSFIPFDHVVRKMHKVTFKCFFKENPQNIHLQQQIHPQNTNLFHFQETVVYFDIHVCVFI